MLTSEVAEAVSEDEEAFLRRVRHPHWRGIVLKAQGGKPVKDLDGLVTRLLSRCNRVFPTDPFMDLWLKRVIEGERGRLKAAVNLVEQGDWSGASFQILSATHDGLPEGMYAKWRQLPQSSARSVSRLLAAAKEMREREIGECFLKAACLGEKDVWRRWAALPPAKQRMCGVVSAIRKGSGEDIDNLAATRDFLHFMTKTVISGEETKRHESSAPCPEWTGVTSDEAIVRAQLEAAEEILRRLRSAQSKLSEATCTCAWEKSLKDFNNCYR